MQFNNFAKQVQNKIFSNAPGEENSEENQIKIFSFAD
jgi:hypothetical protein